MSIESKPKPRAAAAPQPVKKEPKNPSAAKVQDPQPKDTFVGGKEYKVQSGDNLTSIAARFGVTLAELVRVNQLPNPDVLKIGQKLIIPPRPVAPGVAAQEPKKAAETKETQEANLTAAGENYAAYTVEKDDTWDGIAKKLGCDAVQLKVLNSQFTDLIIGQWLIVPPKTPTLLFHREGKRFSTSPADKPAERTEFGTVSGQGVFRLGSLTVEPLLAGQTGNRERAVLAVQASEGKLDAVNSYDNVYFSFGMFQWTLFTSSESKGKVTSGGGEGAALLVDFKAAQPALFKSLFQDKGFDVDGRNRLIVFGKPIDLTRATQIEKLRILRSPYFAHVFAEAARNSEIQKAQIAAAYARFTWSNFQAALGHLKVKLEELPAVELALLLNHHVHRPAHVANGIGEAIKEPGRLTEKLEKLKERAAALGKQVPAKAVAAEKIAATLQAQEKVPATLNNRTGFVAIFSVETMKEERCSTTLACFSADEKSAVEKLRQAYQEAKELIAQAEKDLTALEKS